MKPEFGKLLIGIGILVTFAGILVYFFYDKLHWIGRLPGDIRVEKENFKFFFPITTMILFSIAASLLFHLIKKFF